MDISLLALVFPSLLFKNGRWYIVLSLATPSDDLIDQRRDIFQGTRHCLWAVWLVLVKIHKETWIVPHLYQIMLIFFSSFWTTSTSVLCNDRGEGRWRAHSDQTSSSLQMFHREENASSAFCKTFEKTPDVFWWSTPEYKRKLVLFLFTRKNNNPRAP